MRFGVGARVKIPAVAFDEDDDDDSWSKRTFGDNAGNIWWTGKIISSAKKGRYSVKWDYDNETSTHSRQELTLLTDDEVGPVIDVSQLDVHDTNTSDDDNSDDDDDDDDDNSPTTTNTIEDIEDKDKVKVHDTEWTYHASNHTIDSRILPQHQMQFNNINLSSQTTRIVDLFIHLSPLTLHEECTFINKGCKERAFITVITMD